MAQAEQAKIKVKIADDKKLEIQLTEKALAEYNIRQEQMNMISGLSTNDQDSSMRPPSSGPASRLAAQQEAAQLAESSDLVTNYGQLSGFIPGLNFIRNSVIKPLLFATEKVFEDYIQPAPAHPQPPRQPDPALTTLDSHRKQSIRAPASVSEFTSDSNEDIKSKLSQLQIECTRSSQDASSLKKRRYRELDRCWDFVEGEDADTLRAISNAEGDLRSTRSSNNKRQLKLQKKVLNKVCLEVDLIKSQGRAVPASGFKQQETVTGNFATSIYELRQECLGSLEVQDQQAIAEAQGAAGGEGEGSEETVDLIRFIKTNRNFYNKLVLLWLKFRTVHAERLRGPPEGDLREEFVKYSCSKLLVPAQSQRVKVLRFAAKVIFDEFTLVQQEQDDDLADFTFFANVKSSLLVNWETEIVEKSTSFKKTSSL